MSVNLLQRCTRGGLPGWRWGNRGYCYTYPPDTEAVAKQKAHLESGILIPDGTVQRVTGQGLEDPNAAAKDSIEAQLLAVLISLFGIHLGELLAVLGTPPDRSKIPTNLWPRWESELAQGVRSILYSAALTAGERLILVQNFPVDRERAARKARGWSTARSLVWSAGIILSTRRAVWERISRFLAELGRDLAVDLSFYFGEARAETEAITETTRAFTQGEHLVVTDARGYTLQTEATWRTMRDELVCEVCAERDGLPEGDWPRLPWKWCPLHYRCRCWVTYAGFGDQPPGRWLRGPDRPHIGGLP